MTVAAEPSTRARFGDLPVWALRSLSHARPALSAAQIRWTATVADRLAAAGYRTLNEAPADRYDTLAA